MEFLMSPGAGQSYARYLGLGGPAWLLLRTHV